MYPRWETSVVRGRRHQCSNGGTQVSSFVLDHAGDYCGSWTEQDFDAKTVELCGFPDGPAWGPHDFSVTCDSTTAQLDTSGSSYISDSKLHLGTMGSLKRY